MKMAQSMGFPGVFAGGNCYSGPATVIRAINASNINNCLSYNHIVLNEIELPHVTLKGRTKYMRCEMMGRETSKRIHDFNLIEKRLAEEEAHQKVARCLRCNHFGYGAFRRGESTNGKSTQNTDGSSHEETD